MALLLTAASCTDLKEVPITGITDAYYQTPVGLDAVVNASYSGLHRFYGRQGGFAVTVFGTDEFTNGSDGAYKYLNLYTPDLNGDSQYIREDWDNLYQSINTTNAVISRAPDVAVTDAARAEKVAEARFLRALYYFDLVRLYGDIPLQLEETTTPSLAATREPVAKVYDAIIADLAYAEANLPDQQKDYGRATKPAAQHLLSLVYLTRAQPGDMALAATKAKAVIANPQFGLLPRWADVFDIRNQRHKEVVFSVQYTQDPLTTDGGNTGHLYFLMAYELFPGMVRDIANGRAFKRFRPTTWLLNLWDRSKDSRYEDGFKTVWYTNVAKGTTKPGTCPGCTSGGPLAIGDTAIWMPGTEGITDAFRSSKPYTILTPSQYTDAAYPTLTKFLDPLRAAVNDTAGSRNFMVMRLAETYLIAAEALLRDGRAAEALPYVNAVRERAAKKGVAPSAMDVTTADLSIDFILDERARELAGEQMRWFDLVRTGKLVERVKKYNPQAAVAIRDCHVLRPIPTTEIQRTSPSVAQNACY
jgi:hypothetical protein